MEDMERYMPEERGQTHSAPPPFAPRTPHQFEAQVPQSQHSVWSAVSNADRPTKIPQPRASSASRGGRQLPSASTPTASEVSSPSGDEQGTTTGLGSTGAPAAHTGAHGQGMASSTQRTHSAEVNESSKGKAERTWHANWVDPWTQFKQNVNGSGQYTAPLAQVNESFYSESKPGNVYRTVTSSSDGKPKGEASPLGQEDYPTGQRPVDSRVDELLAQAREKYSNRLFAEAANLCEQVFRMDWRRTDNLLLLGAAHFQLGNFRECIAYNRKAIEINPHFAEAYGNLGNGLKELGDLKGAIQFYCKAIELQPKFCDAYNNLAAAYMQRGQTQQAMETYHMVLMLNPNLVDALSNLGSLYKSQGFLDKAAKCYVDAIDKNPSFAIAWGNLAGIYKDKKDMETAIRYYKEAIRLDPNFMDAYSNLGNTYKECGLIQEAKDAYNKAIEVHPRYAIAYGNLASCYYDEGDMNNAIDAYKKALELEPNFPDVYNNLGNAYRELGQYDESISCYRKALELKQDHPHAYNNLGNSFKDKGMIRESIQCYRTAIQLLPTFAAAHSNLASILKEQGELDAAITHYQEALRIDPNFADAYSNLGNAYKDYGRLNDAILCYSTAIRLKPHFADAYSNLASAYKDSGRIPEAVVCYRKALELKPDFPDAFSNLVHSLVLVCDWRSRRQDFEKLGRLLEEQIDRALGGINPEGGVEIDGESVAVPPLPSVQPFHSLVYPMSLRQMQRLAESYARRAKLNVASLGRNKPVFTFPSPDQMRLPNQRLRIGYVSSDFGNHPLCHLMQSVFGMHNSSMFEVFCYSLSPDDGSPWRRRVMSEMEPGHFVDISSFSHTDAATRIAADHVHILINLNGYTKGARNEVFALRPAPIQVSYMGFCGTMGADYIDYFIVDKTVVPSKLRKYYTEKLVYLPHSYFVNDHRQSARDVLDPSKIPGRSKYGIPQNTFVFANFNQVYKIDPCTFRTWMNILKRVPNSVLWLLRFPASGESNIKMAAQAFGVSPDRIHFTDVAAKDEHLRRGVLVDLFLDTPVCNAHTTGCDILWGGVPMITLPGEKLASRVAASLLNATGLTECIADSLKAYEELAVKLATEEGQSTLKNLRRRLETARHHCPLFDTPRWVRNLERGYMQMWSKFESGLPPDDLEVTDAKSGSRPYPVHVIASESSFDESDSKEAEEVVAKFAKNNPRANEPSISSVVASSTPSMTGAPAPVNSPPQQMYYPTYGGLSYQGVDHINGSMYQQQPQLFGSPQRVQMYPHSAQFYQAAQNGQFGPVHNLTGSPDIVQSWVTGGHMHLSHNPRDPYQINSMGASAQMAMHNPYNYSGNVPGGVPYGTNAQHHGGLPADWGYNQAHDARYAQSQLMGAGPFHFGQQAHTRGN
eukprot:gb/GECG01000337.1/.p1 GENE.gb/GECG01000337.1/~~gb/GECG01000337.1/.p1  ORF type:complete len:1380 (+),score=163.53 gb/GECG01000337.1/:1-4140(+)